MIVITVHGEPVPKQSFRVARANGHVTGYKSDRVVAWESTVAYAAQPTVSGMREPLTGKITVTAEFRLSNRRRVDLDNLWKPVADALNGRLWNDDSQIVNLNIRKVVDRANPGVALFVEVA